MATDDSNGKVVYTYTRTLSDAITRTQTSRCLDTSSIACGRSIHILCAILRAN